MNDQILLTVEQAAQALGLGRSRTYALVASGELPSIRIGHSIRISRRRLELWADYLPEVAVDKVGGSETHTIGRAASDLGDE